MKMIDTNIAKCNELGMSFLIHKAILNEINNL